MYNFFLIGKIQFLIYSKGNNFVTKIDFKMVNLLLRCINKKVTLGIKFVSPYLLAFMSFTKAPNVDKFIVLQVGFSI